MPHQAGGYVPVPPVADEPAAAGHEALHHGQPGNYFHIGGRNADHRGEIQGRRHQEDAPTDPEEARAHADPKPDTKEQDQELPTHLSALDLLWRLPGDPRQGLRQLDTPGGAEGRGPRASAGRCPTCPLTCHGIPAEASVPAAYLPALCSVPMPEDLFTLGHREMVQLVMCPLR